MILSHIRTHLGSLTRKCLSVWAANHPLRRITRGGDEAPYLDRYYLFGKVPDNFPVEVKPRLEWLGKTVFLHHFVDGDREEELHNHPWETSFSVVLAGGYNEERKEPFSTKTFHRKVGAGSFNIIRANDYHKVTLLSEDAWTIFVTGKRVQSWSFWCKSRDEYIPWRQYRAWKEAEIASRTPAPEKSPSDAECEEHKGCPFSGPHYHPGRMERMHRYGTALRRPHYGSPELRERHGLFLTASGDLVSLLEGYWYDSNVVLDVADNFLPAKGKHPYVPVKDLFSFCSVELQYKRKT